MKRDFANAQHLSKFSIICKAIQFSHFKLFEYVAYQEDATIEISPNESNKAQLIFFFLYTILT